MSDVSLAFKYVGVVKALKHCRAETSGLARPGPSRAQALAKFVCALVKLYTSQYAITYLGR